MNFKPSSSENAVIPDVEGETYVVSAILSTNLSANLILAIYFPVAKIPEIYVSPGINRHILGNLDFDVENIEGLTDKRVRTFFAALHDVVMNGFQVIGTNETFTDTLVNKLLQIVELDNWPLMIR